MKQLLYLLLGLVVSGCANHSFHQRISIVDEHAVANAANSVILPEIYYDGFTPITINDEDIFALTKSQKDNFIRYYKSPQNKEVRPNRRLANYLDIFTDGFDYKGDTLNASQALKQKSGNCLSLAIVSTAFAKLADLPYRYKKVHSEPVYQEYGDVQLISSHLNFTVYNPRTEGIDFISSTITIDYFPLSRHIVSHHVSNEEILIMYWHNLAGDAIIENNVDLAFAYTLQANTLNPKHPETLNLFAILYRRIGQTELAYRVYEYIVNNDLSTFTSIDNFANMLEARGETKRAASLWQQVKQFTEDNPYSWLHRGRQHLANNELALAEHFFKRSSHYGPYLHEPHFYLALVYSKQNKFGAVKRALERAQDLAYLPDDQKRYKAKLHGLISSL